MARPARTLVNVDDVALWPGNYPAGHYLSLLVFLGPFVALLAVVLWMAVRATIAERKERRMDVGPLSPAKPTCRHSEAVKVFTVDEQHVGWLCPDCDAVLQPDRRDWPLPDLPPFTPDPRLTTRI